MLQFGHHVAAGVVEGAAGTAGMGVEIEVETSGEREREAMDAVLALINDKFGEGE